jgi:hypothetical protein
MKESSIEALRRILSKKVALRYRWIEDQDRGHKIHSVDVRMVAGELVVVYDQSVDTTTARIIELVAAAEARRHQRRSKASQRAAETRSHRKDYLVKNWADSYLRGQDMLSQPSDRCHICNRRIYDQASRQRGVGTDCWQEVLRVAESMRSIHAKRSESEVQGKRDRFDAVDRAATPKNQITLTEKAEQTIFDVEMGEDVIQFDTLDHAEIAKEIDKVFTESYCRLFLMQGAINAIKHLELWRLLGFDSYDDYLKKHFATVELIAKLQSVVDEIDGLHREWEVVEAIGEVAQ